MKLVIVCTNERKRKEERPLSLREKKENLLFQAFVLLYVRSYSITFSRFASTRIRSPNVSYGRFSLAIVIEFFGVFYGRTVFALFSFFFLFNSLIRLTLEEIHRAPVHKSVLHRRSGLQFWERDF